MKSHRSITLSIALAALLLLASCGKKSGVPSNIIQPDKMVTILTDVYLLEGYFSTQTHFHFDTLQPEMVGCFDSLFAKYEVTKSDFDTSVSWYSQHPDLFSTIHDSVLAHLTVLE